jgi:hypothetical protein
MDTMSRLQEDTILRDALDQTLDLFGEKSKKLILCRIGIIDKDGNKVDSLDNGGHLNYKLITDKIVGIFGDIGSRPVLMLFDQKIEKLAHSRRGIR